MSIYNLKRFYGNCFENETAGTCRYDLGGEHERAQQIAADGRTQNTPQQRAGLGCGRLWIVLDFLQRVPTNFAEIIKILV
jgi:hypothetical protein